MANSLLITNEQAINRATLVQTALASSVLRLIQNYVPSYTDNRAILLANEANFTGYTNGGYPTNNWTGPILPGSGGAALTSPLVFVEPSANNTITNNISAFWIETTGNSPITLLTGIISPAVPVLTPTSGFPIIVQDYEGVSVSPT